MILNLEEEENDEIIWREFPNIFKTSPGDVTVIPIILIILWLDTKEVKLEIQRYSEQLMRE